MSEDAPLVVNLDAMRQMTEWFGEIYDIQLKTLKLNTMLITNSNKVVISIDPPNRNVAYSFQKGDKEPLDKFEGMVSALVKKVFGATWTAQYDTMPVNDTRASSKSKSDSKPKRARGATKKRRKSRK